VLKRRLVILGCTGSIGENALRVAEALPEAIEVVGLAVRTSWRSALDTAIRLGVKELAVEDPAAARACAAAAPAGLRVRSGQEGLVELATLDGADMVLCAVVGMAGFQPVLAAVNKGISVALATKEVLVGGGEIVTEACRRTGARLLLVDSEHSAIFQCLDGAKPEEVRKLILTASGGPFAARPEVDFETVTVEQALNHPRWRMGRKVTIDSATLMNKGLELIEARWLFDVPLERMEVVLHPESLVHSLVQFVDGSLLAQMGPPDMRFAIQHALTWPRRLDGGLKPLELGKLGALHFHEPPAGRFPCLGLAIAAGRAGGTLPAVMNAANEVAVNQFLDKRIPFAGIWRLTGSVMERHGNRTHPSLGDILEADAWARREAESIVKTM
jgi:1-deoxy-D-xylulose-5-phosphate reductoisomerase